MLPKLQNRLRLQKRSETFEMRHSWPDPKEPKNTRRAPIKRAQNKNKRVCSFAYIIFDRAPMQIQKKGRDFSFSLEMPAKELAA